MPTDREIRKQATIASLADAVGNTANASNLANQVDQRLYWVDVPTDTDGETANDGFLILKTDRAIKVVSVAITPQPSTGPNALTANATDFGTIAVRKAAGNTTAANTIVATATTQPTASTNGTGNWVAGVPMTVNINATGSALAVNDVLYVTQRKTLNGLNTPAYRLSVLVQEV